MNPRHLLLLPFFLLTLTALSQNGGVEGFVTDADTRQPLTGATINIHGTKGDQTDLFGRFQITAVSPGAYELVISHIGYKTEIIPVEIGPGLLSAVQAGLRKKELDLSEVRLSSRRYSGLRTLGSVDILLRPVNTSQDVLRIVPGLFIAQHAGGGKAEQIFLRGYDLDHGTDIAITVDGMPVNMVSHAHGQGYADLHFLIPETVEKTSFDKGPYFADKGNQATAAYVDFRTREFLDQNLVKLEAGRFNTQRLAGLFKIADKHNGKNHRQLYTAGEYFISDGYFNSPQDFHRLNLFAKYNAWYGHQAQLTFTASAFSSSWNASGQIPDRAVRLGTIDRFGAIDDTEGGTTSRFNFSATFNRQGRHHWKMGQQLYFSRYAFDLFSNFTFFLEDPVHGDMIRQQEKRNIFGYTATASKNFQWGTNRSAINWGAGFRHDAIRDIGLSKATRTTFYSDRQRGDILETNSFLYINQELDLGKKWNLYSGLRLDQFRFAYKDRLTGDLHYRKQSKWAVSPKLNFVFNANPFIKFYLNNGIGFHSNDTRVILSRQASRILPNVYGTDLGVILKPAKQILVKAAIWHLYSEQEFVYVGDAGIVEAGGKTRRIGADISVRYQFSNWLFGDLDINLSRARLVNEPKGGNFVPLAPAFTSIGGITAKSKKGFSGSLRYRFLDARPANETNTIRAAGYFLLDMVLAYRLKKFEITLSGENLLNRPWREAQFDTESRLRNEMNPVSEIHYTPGAPRFIKGGVSIHF